MTTWRSSLPTLFEPPKSPSEFLARSVRQSSVSFTIGVFVGAAITTGVAVGAVIAWAANDKVLRQLTARATGMITSARDAALSSREGQVITRALLRAGRSTFSLPSAPSPPSTEDDAADATSPAPAAPAAAAVPPRLSAALRPGEALPQVSPAMAGCLAYIVCGSSVQLAGYTSRSAKGSSEYHGYCVPTKTHGTRPGMGTRPHLSPQVGAAAA